MPKKIALPDGSIAEFPDSMSDAEIERVIAADGQRPLIVPPRQIPTAPPPVTPPEEGYGDALWRDLTSMPPRVRALVEKIKQATIGSGDADPGAAGILTEALALAEKAGIPGAGAPGLAAGMRGAVAGGAEGAGGLLTPLNVATAVAGPLGRMAGATGAALSPTGLAITRGLEIGTSIPTAVEGALDIKEGNVGRGIAELALAGIGAHGGGSPRTDAPLPRVDAPPPVDAPAPPRAGRVETDLEIAAREAAEAIDDAPVAAADGTTANASGESAASAEAISRQGAMAAKKEQFVVYDRAGNRRPLIGPDAVDYVAKKGETYGVEGPDGFRTLDNKGGKVPPPKPPDAPPPPADAAPPPDAPPPSGETPPPQPEPLIDRLKKTLAAAVPIRQKIGGKQHEARVDRAAKLREIYQDPQGMENLSRARQALAGEMTNSADFEPIRTNYTVGEIDDLANRINLHTTLRPFEKTRALEALEKLMGQQGMTVPQKAEIALLERVFGKLDMPAAPPKPQTWGDKFLRYWNLRRDVLTGPDMSIPLRQGLLLLNRTKQSGPAFKEMVRSFFSEGNALKVQAEIENRPNFALHQEVGLAHTPWEADAPITAREEGVGNSILASVPYLRVPFRASNRASSTFLNKLRADVFDDVVAHVLMPEGITYESHPQAYKALADWINIGSGRGDLGALERIAPLLNATFFSPRLMASRYQVLNPKTYFDLRAAHPLIAKEAGKDMARTAASIIGILSLAAAGGAAIEMNPKSVDFAKIRIGKARQDILGGLQQWVRFYAQFAYGEKKTLTGEIKEADRWELLGRFLRSKLHPTAGMAVDIATGENLIGEEVTPGTVVKDLATPMFGKDVAELAQDEPAALPMAVPAWFGAGVQTYPAPASAEDAEKAVLAQTAASEARAIRQRFDLPERAPHTAEDRLKSAQKGKGRAEWEEQIFGALKDGNVPLAHRLIRAAKNRDEFEFNLKRMQARLRGTGEE